MALVCKILYALVIARELGFISGNSDGKNSTGEKINSVLENDIIIEYEEYLSNHYDIKLNSKMETLPSMY